MTYLDERGLRLVVASRVVLALGDLVRVRVRVRANPNPNPDPDPDPKPKREP